MIEITRPLMTLVDEDGNDIGLSKSSSEVEAMEKASGLAVGTYYLQRPNAKIVVSHGTQEPVPDPVVDPPTDPVGATRPCGPCFHSRDAPGHRSITGYRPDLQHRCHTNVIRLDMLGRNLTRGVRYECC